MLSKFLKGNKLQMTYSVFSSDFCMNRITSIFLNLTFRLRMQNTSPYPIPVFNIIIVQFSINLMDRSFLDGSTQFCENN